MEKTKAICNWPVRREGVVKRAGRMRRQIVEHHPDALGPRIMEVGEFAHADGEVGRRAALADLDLAPGAAAMLPSPRRPSRTMRILSSAE